MNIFTRREVFVSTSLEKASQMLKEYRLYVHKDDVELAVSLMNKPGF